MQNRYWLSFRAKGLRNGLQGRRRNLCPGPGFYVERLGIERLEERTLLSVGPVSGDPYSEIAPLWFSEAAVASPEQEETLLAALDSTAGDRTAAEHVEVPTSSDRWIVRLTSDSLQQVSSVADTAALLNGGDVRFQVIRGLGLPGQVLVRTTGSESAAVEAVLSENAQVAHFERDAVVTGQADPPDDPRFGDLWALRNVGQSNGTPGADVKVLKAWDVTTGSTGVTVAVVDSGIDPTHHDLYQNIWINQGEIPQQIVDGLTYVDADTLITFYDLNDQANADQVKDFNDNGYIDAHDLLADPRWADGYDTDGNGFVDDFFGWDFRNHDPDPLDDLGHGTHVAGTIGAVGNNAEGVVGINWSSSLMALKFLDENNAGHTSDAIAAINYATMMRIDHEVNVRVINASWGQPGGYSPGLEAAIEASGAADMLFVAAAGNGNILGWGMDNDAQPFYPASYELDNIIAVAATDHRDELARFSDFGVESVDIAAPGVGILSTTLGGGYGFGKGTSMAAPHVSGVAALVWAQAPYAITSEVRDAIFDGADLLPDLAGKLATGGRLNVYRALTAETFAPRAELVSAPNITTAGGNTQQVVVEYTDNQGLNTLTLDDAAILVTHLRDSREEYEAKLVLPVPPPTIGSRGEQIYTVTYEMAAPGDRWDVLDYGDYEISLQAGQVYNKAELAARPIPLGTFQVKIEDETVFYVNSFDDVADANVGDGHADADLETPGDQTTLRAAIQEANAADAHRTIILAPGIYQLSIPPQAEDEFATGDLDLKQANGDG